MISDWSLSWLTILVATARRAVGRWRSPTVVRAWRYDDLSSKNGNSESATAFWEDANSGWLVVYIASLAGCVIFLIATGGAHSIMEIGLSTLPVVLAAGGLFKSYLMASKLNYPNGPLRVTGGGHAAWFVGIFVQTGAIFLLRLEGRAFV